MFDKTLLINNIRYLAKENSIKIGELEETAGVSVGYISRIEKSDSVPTIDFVEKIATKLNVSVDMLINGRFTTISETDLYFSKFIEKLLSNTINEKLHWEKEEKSLLSEHTLIVHAEDSFSHPLFEEYSDPMGITHTYKYTSQFHDPNKVLISGDCFNCKFNEDARIYLMVTDYFSDNNKNNEFEVYLVEDEFTINKMINAPIKSTQQLSKSLSSLYEAANESSKHVNIPESAKNLIDSFMNN